MGGPVYDKQEQMKYLHQRIELLMTMLDNIDPEEAGVEDIDRIIEMLDELETKAKQYRNHWDGK
ncbi:SE1561 family protein [Alteribacter populi]|uniref:SE1561 family protein n=1 Tax=Alteribacter populi TaxID=2011011 RepID=UPI000BBAB813|nr:SE1561 family protein [Alteribacter populi]